MKYGNTEEYNAQQRHYRILEISAGVAMALIVAALGICLYAFIGPWVVI